MEIGEGRGCFNHKNEIGKVEGRIASIFTFLKDSHHVSFEAVTSYLFFLESKIKNVKQLKEKFRKQILFFSYFQKQLHQFQIVLIQLKNIFVRKLLHVLELEKWNPNEGRKIENKVINLVINFESMFPFKKSILDEWINTKTMELIVYKAMMDKFNMMYDIQFIPNSIEEIKRIHKEEEVLNSCLFFGFVLNHPKQKNDEIEMLDHMIQIRKEMSKHKLTKQKIENSYHAEWSNKFPEKKKIRQSFIKDKKSVENLILFPNDFYGFLRRSFPILKYGKVFKIYFVPVSTEKSNLKPFLEKVQTKEVIPSVFRIRFSKFLDSDERLH